MKYNNYSIEDFASDTYFQIWVFEGDLMANKFWSDWMVSHPEKKEIIADARKLVLLMGHDEDKLSKEDFDKMWKYIVLQRDLKKVEPKNHKSFLLKIAAVFVGLFTLSYAVYYFKPFLNKEQLVANVDTEARITLELEDGSVVYLDEMNSETINNKTKAIASNSNSLSYKSTKNNEVEKLVYNKITVPYGKKFELELSDGSRVTLNAGTQLKYPIRFLKDQPRNVYLEGEAFFEVAKDKKNAFTVVTDKMNTRVYGTKFNVSCYKNENKIATVLVEGSVGVYKKNGGDKNKPLLIKPGYKALYSEKNIEVTKVDISKYIAWTHNEMVFLNDSFDVIIKRLERKYNVKIQNEYSLLSAKKFTGVFKDESLESILKIFKEHTPFNYKVEKNTVTITK
ncbi:ferric-dicitrate binding protein FerR (iron transport regulator) [Wenyingzhuangia heitensis]|uniref:Ferric-dicitrate binding protein FerR (Iron transport regulator) n=1 Tax=Wenyingzhuangia heitensis TaxID=1487859 RepID=A0ABX0U4Y2_9FLAO|nr:FecR family protein [Wenyingzhuangia heitensis]NIJ43904.1 ferric-dicitrate binding protein FerR (iron transport regulator) [Wenyingzhuangia heitensis]